MDLTQGLSLDDVLGMESTLTGFSLWLDRAMIVFSELNMALATETNSGIIDYRKAVLLSSICEMM